MVMFLVRLLVRSEALSGVCVSLTAQGVLRAAALRLLLSGGNSFGDKAGLSAGAAKWMGEVPLRAVGEYVALDGGGVALVVAALGGARCRGVNAASTCEETCWATVIKGVTGVASWEAGVNP